ncbi:hypothetical protein [Luteibacter yeojuensis]|uniref:Uncharacterized protein n=1 Tax=Luteibacter yeojuensis TaxID=345309 RepID=A0A7X5QU92_9GAMM|nr:hypothetical protein [Luteibacter yeojuensis]NID15420.1 hypothetical protein [Luteibacter yeojuensis]
MGTNQRKPNCQTLADRAGELVNIVNNLIADIESDLSAPGEAALHTKDAYRTLCRAHNALIDAAREQTVTHYQGLAQQAAA